MGKKAGKIALGLGLITGAVTGLLFAPEEGKKVRKKIASGDTKGLLKDLAHMGEELSEVVVEFAKNPHVVDAVEKAKGAAADAANMKREELDEMLAKANIKADEFKKTVEKYVKEQKKVLDETYGTKKKKKKSTKKKTTSKKKAPAKKKTTTKKKAPAKKTTAKKKAPAKKKSTTKKKK